MKKMILAIVMGVMMLAGASVMTTGVLAAGETICSDGSATDDMKDLAGCNEKTMADAVVNIGLNLVISVTGIIAVGVMVYGGFIYLTSQGDPSRAKRGRDVILYGLVGLGVAALAFTIVNFVVANLPSPE